MTADGGKYQEKSFPYELCPGCDEMKQEEVYGRSFTPALETKSSSCPSGKCASAS